MLAPGLLAAGRLADLHRARQLDRLQRVLASGPGIPPAGGPVCRFVWAIVVGVIAAILGAGLKWLALVLRCDRRTPKRATDTRCRRRMVFSS